MSEKRKIIVNVEVCNVITRWPCFLCTDCVDKTNVVFEWQDARGTARLCQRCWESGPDGIRARIAKRIEETTADEEWLRQVQRSEFVLPSAEDFERAEYESERYFVRDDGTAVDIDEWRKWRDEWRKSLEHPVEGDDLPF